MKLKKLSLIEISLDHARLSQEALERNLNVLSYNEMYIVNFNDFQDRLINLIEYYIPHVPTKDLFILYNKSKSRPESSEIVKLILELQYKYPIFLRETKEIAAAIINLDRYKNIILSKFYLTPQQNPIQFYQNLLERAISYGSVNHSKKIRELLLTVTSFASSVQELGLSNMAEIINGLVELEREYF